MPPIAIGGVGGSGTRLIAEMVRTLGVHLGNDLNRASDTLWFTLLFKRYEILDCGDREFNRLVRILVCGLRGGPPLDPSAEALIRELSRSDRPQHRSNWLQERCESLLASTRQPRPGQRWGWKEPNTHVVIERLWQCIPELRYIHVVRNGLDMAFSSNQNQLRLWGCRMLGEDGPASPQRALAYWCRVHRRMQALMADNPTRMHWLDYDALCRYPQQGAAELCRFLGYDSAPLISFLDGVRQPAEPRHTRHSIDNFADADLAYVRSLGYVINPA